MLAVPSKVDGHAALVDHHVLQQQGADQGQRTGLTAAVVQRLAVEQQPHLATIAAAQAGFAVGAEAAAATHLHAGQAAQQAGQVSGLQRVDCHADLHAALIQRGLLAVHHQRWQCGFGVARNRAAQRRHQGQALQVCRQIRPGEAHGESIGNRQTVAAWQLPSVRFALRDHGT